MVGADTTYTFAVGMVTPLYSLHCPTLSQRGCRAGRVERTRQLVPVAVPKYHQRKQEILPHF